MSNTNIFEQASRKQLRFTTPKGLMPTEMLWELPLQSKAGNVSLDSIAIDVNRHLKSLGEESFVSSDTNSAARAENQLRLDILKHIIAVKQAEYKAAADAVARKAERDRLVGALARKQEAAVEKLSEEELQRRIAALGG